MAWNPATDRGSSRNPEGEATCVRAYSERSKKQLEITIYSGRLPKGQALTFLYPDLLYATRRRSSQWQSRGVLLKRAS